MIVSRVPHRSVSPQTSRTSTPMPPNVGHRSSRTGTADARDDAETIRRTARVDGTRRIREPGPGEIRIAIAACGVCRTDLHVVDRELPRRACRSSRATRSSAASMHSGRRSTACALVNALACRGSATPAAAVPYCEAGTRICAIRPQFTGYTRDGGFATATIADARYAFPGRSRPTWRSHRCCAPD